ncbi:M16 family metallopeptidase [Marinomonas spartinae]|uniref:M16 family metallopeptidase n=1 Tax=Marinomonas spartinae TaxID=1792290 RepID=UPI0018F14E5B|nr:M16 family metallopeptidase [Marinomonas spartinae]MBJ7556574.1 insulinase family protein [Marinomonas spartinae]
MNNQANAEAELVASVPDLAFQRFKLDNGLTLLVHEDHQVPMVAVHVGYNVGAKDEPKGMFGFAHLMEHLMFSGSEALPGSYISHLEQAGSQGLNGVTNADMTQFFQSVPVGSLDFTLFAESDRMGALLTELTAEALETQRDVVTREMEEGELQPYGSVQGAILRHLFPAEHPYAHKVAGEYDDLQNIDFTQVIGWLSKFYRPNNAVITLAGDITAEQALAKVKEYFGHIPSGPALEKCDRWLPILSNERRVTVQDRVESTLLRICWVVPPYIEQSTIALELFAGLLVDTAESLLVKRLMVENALATDISAFIETGMLASYFNLRIVLPSDVLPLDVERIALQALQDMLHEGLNAESLKYSQYAFLQSVDEAWSDNLSLAAELGKHEMYPSKAEGAQLRVKQAMMMSVDDVLSAASEWLGRGRLVLTVEPYSYLGEASLATLAPRTPPVIKVAPMKKVTTTQDFVLSNGLRVIQNESDDASMVSISLIVNAGSKYDPVGKEGLANLVAGLVCANESFQQQIQQQNLFYEIDVSVENVALRMQAQAKNVGALLSLLSDTVTRACLPLADEMLINSHRDYYLKMIETQEVVQWVLPMMTFAPSHPLRRPAFTLGSRASIQSLTTDSAQTFYQAHYRPENATLMIHGSLPESQQATLLELLESRWVSNKSELSSEILLSPPSLEGALVLVNQPEFPVVNLNTFFVLPGRGGGDDAATQLIYPLLAASFGSRINFSMREVYRLTYNVVGMQHEFPETRLLGFEMVVGVDSIVPSIRAICQELHELLTTKPLTIKEMKALVQSECLRLSKPINDYETMCQQELLVRQKLGKDYWLELAEKIQSINIEDVNNLINKFLLPKKGKWIIQGDVARYSNELESMLSLSANYVFQYKDEYYS